MNIAVQFAFALHFSYSGFDIAPHHCLGIHINANFMLVLVAGKGKFLLFPCFYNLAYNAIGTKLPFPPLDLASLFMPEKSKVSLLLHS